MNKSTYLLLLAGFAAVGCQSARSQLSRLPSTKSVENVAGSPATASSAVVPATHELLLLQPNEAQPSLPLPLPIAPLSSSAATSIPSELSLTQLEQMALAGNPSLAQAEARVRALRGRWTQVGLPPNPTAGYLASEVGNEGRAGQQGGYVGQEFITGGKLRLNRAVVAQEIQRAEQEQVAMQLRVLTDVRKAYYSALLAQRRTEVAAELSRATTRAAAASKELFEVAGDIPRPALLQAQIEQQNAGIFVQNAENERLATRRQLSAVVGSDLSGVRLSGEISQLPAQLDWEQQLSRTTAASPEMAAAFAEVARAQAALQRACVEPVPDVNTQFIVQYDNASEDSIAGVQVGLPLPIWNRNQGGIRQAEAEITAARRNADRVELDLKRRLAIAFQAYTTARSQAEIYATQILPKAQESFELVQRGYTLGELGYLDYLSAQRTYSQTNLAYLDALSALWSSWNEMEGLLLSGSLISGNPQ
jgi:cobalt-zinc-cadmium efflux system outer membrane protein